MSTTLSLAPPARLRRPGVVAGVAVSLVLHALLIFGYRLTLQPAPRNEPPARSMTVWLQPPKPPAPVAVVEPPPPKPAQPRKREKKEIATASNTRPSPAAPAETPASSSAQAVTLPAPSSPVADPLHPELQPKKFDMNAALKTARKVANEKDPARAGLPVAQLEDHPLYPERTDTQLARDIAGAKRSDCKNTPGGLLAPLIWLMDKKDSGCKW